jgi:hypothetical protein
VDPSASIIVQDQYGYVELHRLFVLMQVKLYTLDTDHIKILK